MYKKISLLVLLAVSFSLAQTAGNSGMAFLKLGFGARNIAMGDAASANASDVTSLFYNPSRLSVNPANEIMLMHNEWIQGVRSELLGARTVVFGLPFALGINFTSVDNIEVRNVAGPALSLTSANSFFIGVSSGFNIYKGISAGFTVKYLYESIFVDEANGMGYDFGLNYESPVEGLSFSAVIKNLGSMDELKAEKTKLPTEFRIGSAYRFKIEQPKLAITAAADFQKYTPTSDVHINAGAEVLYDNLISLRAGYQSGYISKSITAGLGLRYGFLSFDYALSPFTYGLGTGHTVSLTFNF